MSGKIFVNVTACDTCGNCANCMKGRYTLCLNYGKPATGHRHYGMASPGANCEYNAYATKAIHKIPDNLSFVHAALLDTAGVALHGIDMIGLTAGGTAAVWGPGPIGLISIQMMKGMGAKTVIAVGRRHRLKVAGEVGADVLIDYEKEDPAKRIKEVTGGIGADEIQECSGANVAIDQCVASVRSSCSFSSESMNWMESASLMPFATAVSMTSPVWLTLWRVTVSLLVTWYVLIFGFRMPVESSYTG